MKRLCSGDFARLLSVISWLTDDKGGWLQLGLGAESCKSFWALGMTCCVFGKEVDAQGRLMLIQNVNSFEKPQNLKTLATRGRRARAVLNSPGTYYDKSATPPTRLNCTDWMASEGLPQPADSGRFTCIHVTLLAWLTRFS